MFSRTLPLAAFAAALFCSSAIAADQPGSTASDGSQAWYTFAGQLNAQKYATADQITPDNVGKLQTAWDLHTGDVSDGNDPKGPKASRLGRRRRSSSTTRFMYRRRSIASLRSSPIPAR